MKSRGAKQWAVMATKPNWSKPRFVYGSPQHRWLFIYDNKQSAKGAASRMNDDIGGVFLTRDGKRIFNVVYKAVPVWTETML